MDADGRTPFQEGQGQGCSLSILAHLPCIEAISWSHSVSDGKENWTTVSSITNIKHNQVKQHAWRQINSEILLKQAYNVEIEMNIKHVALSLSVCPYQNCSRRACASVVQLPKNEAE